MTQQLEDALRTAFQEKASQIPPIAPPLHLEAQRQVIRSGTRRTVWMGPGRRKLIAGLGAAAAVAAVAIGIAVASGPSVPPAQPPAGPAATPPPYYVAIRNSSPRVPQPQSFLSVAVVRSTRTGAVIATVQAPRPYVDFVGVTGAADDRTFVLEASSWPRDPSGRVNRFYLLRIAPGAGSAEERARLTPLPVVLPWSHALVQGMALSPDGASLAVVASPGEQVQNRIFVYNLATGASHVWTDQGCRDNCITAGLLDGNYTMNGVSWTADGRRLGFAQQTGASEHPQFRLLNVGTGGGSLLADSQPVTLRAEPGVLDGSALRDTNWAVSLITPDGSSVIIGAANQSTGQTLPPLNLLRYSARTGALQAVLAIVPVGPDSNDEQVLWTSPNGGTVLVVGFRGNNSAGLLHDGHYTPIPWSQLILSAAW